MKAIIFIFTLGVLLSGCNKDENPVGADAVGTYVGNFISITYDAGLIVVTVSSSGAVSGNVVMWEDSLRSVTVSGTVNGNTFTGTASDGTPLSGTLSNGVITGTAGTESTFSIRLASGPVQLLKYMGSYVSTSGPSESGTLIIHTAATAMWGVVIDDASPGEASQLVGTVTGTTISARDASDPSTEVATGTLSGSTWSGTYTGDQSSGTWTVTLVP